MHGSTVNGSKDGVVVQGSTVNGPKDGKIDLVFVGRQAFADIINQVGKGLFQASCLSPLRASLQLFKSFQTI